MFNHKSNLMQKLLKWIIIKKSLLHDTTSATWPSPLNRAILADPGPVRSYWALLLSSKQIYSQAPKILVRQDPRCLTT